MYTKLFTPFNVGNCTVPNRLVVPAMVTNYCTEDGFLTERYFKYIEEKNTDAEYDKLTLEISEELDNLLKKEAE